VSVGRGGGQNSLTVESESIKTNPHRVSAFKVKLFNQVKKVKKKVAPAGGFFYIIFFT
jgi:hypothetical protein